MCPFCSDVSLEPEDSLEAEGYVCDFNEKHYWEKTYSDNKIEINL